jgi:hypothetical protein
MDIDRVERRLTLGFLAAAALVRMFRLGYYRFFDNKPYELVIDDAGLNLMRSGRLMKQIRWPDVRRAYVNDNTSIDWFEVSNGKTSIRFDATMGSFKKAWEAVKRNVDQSKLRRNVTTIGLVWTLIAILNAAAIAAIWYWRFTAWTSIWVLGIFNTLGYAGYVIDREYRGRLPLDDAIESRIR